MKARREHVKHVITKASLSREVLKEEEKHLLPKKASLYQKIFGVWKRIREELSDRSLKKTNYPKGLFIDLSSYCNIRCSICSLNQYYIPKSNMSTKTFLKLEPFFQHFEYIHLGCNAEPLMSKYFLDALRIIRTKNPSCILGFNTNGVMLSGDISRSLVRYKINYVCISLDGITPQTFGRIKVGAKLDKIMVNIKKLKKIKKSASELPNIYAQFVSTRDNIEELPTLIKMVPRLGIIKIKVNGLEPYSKEMSTKTLYYPPNPRAKSIFKKAQEIAQRVGVELELPSLEPLEREKCEKIRDLVIISPEGDVIPCTMLSYNRPYYYFGEHHEHQKITFGNINHDTFENIWNSEASSNLRSQLLSSKHPDFCQNCLLIKGVLTG